MSYNYTQGGPTAPMGGAPDPAIGQAGLMDVVNSWITSLTKPSVATYAAEVPRATQNRLIMSVGIVTVIAALAGLLGGVFGPLGVIGGFITALITTPLGFLVGVAAYYAGAKIMKGTGTFLEHAWVWSTIWAPVTIISSIVGIIPILGGIVSFIIGLVALYFYYLSIQAVHRLEGSNAILAIVIGFVITLVVGLVVGLIVTSVLLIVGLGASAAGAITGR